MIEARPHVISPLRVAIGGLGAIGMSVAQALDRGIDGLTLSAVGARDVDKARQKLLQFTSCSPSIVPISQLADVADIVVECTPAAVYDEVARPAVQGGKILITLSSGALLMREDLIALARRSGARIVVPSGGILGLDALKSVALDEVHSVTLISRKPPRSLEGAPYLVERNILVHDLQVATRVFQGDAREAAMAFPANANVAATISLAGVGPTRTLVEIWADPAALENVQELRVRSAAADFDIRLASHPLKENPRTGSLTPKSVIATLRSLVSHIAVGTL